MKNKHLFFPLNGKSKVIKPNGADRYHPVFHTHYEDSVILTGVGFGYLEGDEDGGGQGWTPCEFSKETYHLLDHVLDQEATMAHIFVNDKVSANYQTHKALTQVIKMVEQEVKGVFFMTASRDTFQAVIAALNPNFDKRLYV